MLKNLPEWFKKVAFLLQAGLIGLGLAFLWVLISGKNLHNLNESTQPNYLSFANAVERAQPAVVSIQTSTLLNQRTRTTPWSTRRAFRQKGLGSGVIVDATGIVLTNYHVIKNVDSILVILPDGRSASAQIIGTDQDTDLAVLRINSGGVNLNLPTLNFANSQDQSIGDVVLAIGNPYGIGQTVTQGIISATGRANINLAIFEDFIQTDATISAGNSGGALINTRGELIGINTAEYSQQGEDSGIGFAIPADLAKGVTQAILDNGRVIRGWLGLATGSWVDASGQKVATNLKGAIIGEVEPGSPAALAGIERYDILIAINDTEIDSDLEAKYTIASLKPDEKVKLRIRRGDKLYDIETMVVERPISIT